jgi:hypothetical protein
MAIKASTEAIAAMRSDIQRAIREITDISGRISQAGRPSGDWSDAQSQQYTAVMQKASKATLQPLETLKAAIPKLNKLEQALQGYSSVKFN